MKRFGHLPHLIAASLLYFALAVVWLSSSQNMALLPALKASATVYIVMTGIALFAVPWMRRAEGSPDPGRMARLLFGGSPSEPPIEEDETKKTEKFRRQARIEALERDTRKMRDKVLRMGALISVALVLYAGIMRAAFGLTPKEVYFVPWLAIAVLWFVQIVFFPRWLTYISFLVMGGLRFGLQTFGPNILMMLPNFIMLPFFYLLMMLFMFGSIMLPNLMQQKYFKPGEGDWQTPEGSTRGQFQPRAVIETQIDRFVRYAKRISNRKPTRGIVFEGPPGIGKTLYAKEIATKLELPFVQSDASAFSAPFAGFGQLLPLIMRFRTEALAKEYGGAVVFIDEGEILFGARSGMQQPTPFTREVDEWDVLNIHGCQVFDVPHVRTRQWNEQQMALATQPAPPVDGKHNIFMLPGATGGASGAIFPFLTWMSGAQSPPLMEKFIRSRINEIFSVILPVTIGDRILRLPPGKPQESNVLFITATNRFFMFDPAMIRPGRFGIIANFVMPDEDERYDTAWWYLLKWHRMGYYQDDLIRPERIREFAKATPNASQAEIEQMIEEAVDVRVQHVADLRRLKRYADEEKLGELPERDQKYWRRFKRTVYDDLGNEIPGWDDERVDWHALMESKSAISFGRANPEATGETTQVKVGFHEKGHAVATRIFNRKRVRVTLMSAIPRRGSLGMVAHVPYDTREQHPQEYYEALVRTSLASWVTERFFFGQNLPGVTGDLKNATGVAVLMVGRFGMPSFACTDKERKYYAAIGEDLISEPEVNMFNPQANALVASVLHNPQRRKGVATILGMAAIDSYRLIRPNKQIFREVIPEFLKIGEYSGAQLEELLEKIDREVVPLHRMSKEDREALPARAFAIPNSFYGETEAEGLEIYKEVMAQIEEGART